MSSSELVDTQIRTRGSEQLKMENIYNSLWNMSFSVYIYFFF